HSFPMVGVFPTRARMQPGLAALGYAEVEGMNKTGWLRPGEPARGHEFRYSVIDEMPEQIQRRYRVSTMAGERQDGFSVGSVLASYVHLHFGSCPRFAALCCRVRGKLDIFRLAREGKDSSEFFATLFS